MPEESGPGQRAQHTRHPLPAPLGPQLPVIGNHVSRQVPGVVGDLDVGRRQVAIVPPRLTGEAHGDTSLRGP